ncbi:MAG: hypothetical protein ACR652_10180 [Methylocystis sp.]|uniref:hypothetical protein n=1 Tax=Methylocystis sp. TaxID=1911079 RepID=UPI003DA2AF68
MKIALKIDALANDKFTCDFAILPPNVDTLAYLFKEDMDTAGLKVAFDEGWITLL